MPKLKFWDQKWNLCKKIQCFLEKHPSAEMFNNVLGNTEKPKNVVSGRFFLLMSLMIFKNYFWVHLETSQNILKFFASNPFPRNYKKCKTTIKTWIFFRRFYDTLFWKFLVNSAIDVKSCNILSVKNLKYADNLGEKNISLNSLKKKYWDKGVQLFCWQSFIILCFTVLRNCDADLGAKIRG